MSDMKKILLSAIALTALATGCNRDAVPNPATADGKATLTASFDIPDADPTRAITSSPIADGQIGSLWVMVFNEAGNYISRHKGDVSENNPSNYIFPEIIISELHRTLHFVANYDWIGFSDAAWIGQSESTVLLAMSVAADDINEPTTAYWQRVEMEKLIPDDENNPTIPIPGTVSLLRNVARISVVNNSERLTDVSFAVGNRHDRGAVAPYNTTTYRFGTGDVALDLDGFVTEAPGASVISLVENRDFLPAGDIVDLYERRNSTAIDNAFVVVKAHFDGDPGWSYYKIDVVEDDATVLPDLVRNHHYKINIDAVYNDGAHSLEDAVSSLASNNVNASVVASNYTDISNVNGVLHVDRTAMTLVRTAEAFRIGYFYKNRSTDAYENDGVTITLSQQPGREVVETETEGFEAPPGGPAYIVGTTAGALPVNDIYRATLTISKGGLTRVVNLELRPVMDFTVSTLPADGDVGADGEATIHFRFPDNISASLFPMEVRIHTRKFTPAQGQELSVGISEGGGDFYFVYTARTRESTGPGGAHVVELVAISNDANDTVRLEADLFNPNSDARFR
jgi:hypothetical protein